MSSELEPGCNDSRRRLTRRFTHLRKYRELLLGPERAERSNPARSALNRGLKLILHHGAPIAHWGMRRQRGRPLHPLDQAESGPADLVFSREVRCMR